MQERRLYVAKDPFSWQPEILSGMTTGSIVKKLKEFVPAFELNSFIAKTGRYISSEDLTEEEYYPQATFSDVDEDFIWMACEELWKRLVPDRLPVELVAEQVDNLVEEIMKAGEKQRWNEVFRRSREALDLICRYTIEETPVSRRLRRDFYEKLRQATFSDFDSVIYALIRNLMEHEEYQRVIDITGTIGDGLGDDIFLDYKAESLFALGKKNEAENLYQDIIGRNPDDPWFLLHTGDCYVTNAEKDFTKGKNYYLEALSIAEKHRKRPDGKDELRAVYQRLIDLADDNGEHDEVSRYQHLLDSLDATKVGRNDPCPCGSGKKYKKCCGRDLTAELQPPPFDRRIMERDLLALSQHLEGKNFDSVEEMNTYIKETIKTDRIPQWIPVTPLEQAQNLIFEARETMGKKRRELAEQALRISPDCADAYVLLAEEKVKNPEEAVSLYETGVKAANVLWGRSSLSNGLVISGAC